jgi:ATP-dependent RNA helicase RhlE
MKFEKFDLSDEVKENLKSMGFFRTTDIQFKVIPAILNGEDVLAIAQTGTGKTAAFAIPIIHKIHEEKSSRRHEGVRCLVMVPTRELAQQIGKVFSQISRKTRANSFALYGGVEQDPQIEQLKGGVDILIATPGRLFDLISQGHVDPKGVDTLVLDEADHMLDLGFIKDIQNIKEKLTRRHQTLFFSATINSKIKKLAYSQVRSQALRIQVSPENLVSKNVTHSIVKVSMEEKRHLLLNFLHENPEGKVIVFVRTQVRAERVLAHLEKNALKALGLHGGMAQGEREKNLELFRSEKSGVLITTDVSARGIDLPAVTHVINYDLPDEPENYVHRVGRTGRGFSKGEALSFCSPEEAEKLARIQEFIQTEISALKIDDAYLKESLVTPDLEKMSVADMLAMEEERFGVGGGNVGRRGDKTGKKKKLNKRKFQK